MRKRVAAAATRMAVVAWTAGLVVLLASLPALAQTARPSWPETLTIGTGSPGGTYHVYGAGLARLLTRELGLQVLTRPSEGPTENIKLLEAGEVQLAFVTLGVAQQGWNASADWTGGRQLRAMRAMFPMYDTPFQFLVKNDAPAQTIGDLAGRRVGIGPQGGTGGIYTPLILKALKVETTLVPGTWSELAAGLSGGQLDALIAVGGVPLPEVLDLDRRGAVRSLGLTPAQTVALRLALPELAASTIAAGTYPSLRRHYQTVGVYNFAVAHSRLPDDLVYAILEAVFAGNEELMAAHPAAAETVPANFTRNAVLPFHGGATRWFANKAATGVVRGD